MLQITYLRDHKEQAIAGLSKRYFAKSEEMVEKVIAIDQTRRNTQTQLDQIKAELNTKSRSIGKLRKEGKQAEFEEAQKQTGVLKQQIKKQEQVLQESAQALNQLLYEIPNVPYSSVPEGRTPEDNEIASEKGTIPDLAEGALPHWDLIEKYDIIDFKLGSKVTGAGFPFYKGKGARLQRALINFFLDEALKAGYLEVQPPLMINQDSGLGTGQLPDKEGQMYHATQDDFYLIPTAEVPITNMYRNEIVEENQFPIKLMGYTPCFRREAGSWGADVRGLNRLHQFDKVEIVQIQHPDKSYETLEEMLKHSESLLEKLELPYRVLKLCAGDLGFTSAFTYDLEVYSAAQKRWLEVSSVSNFEAYQANRLKLRYRSPEHKKPQLAHTLNGSALALPRIVAAILENNQYEGGIHMPKVLRPYTGFSEIN